MPFPPRTSNDSQGRRVLAGSFDPPMQMTGSNAIGSGGGGLGTDIDLLQEDGSLILQEDGTSTITKEG